MGPECPQSASHKPVNEQSARHAEWVNGNSLVVRGSQMCDGLDRSDRDEDTPIRAKSIQLEC